MKVSRQGDHRGGAQPGADGAAGGVGNGQTQSQDGQEDPEPGEPQPLRLHRQHHHQKHRQRLLRPRGRGCQEETFKEPLECRQKGAEKINLRRYNA